MGEGLSGGGGFGKKGKLPFWGRRLLEFLVINLICSVPIAALDLIGFIPIRSFYWGAGFSGLAFLVLNIVCLRDYILFVGSVKTYLQVNYFTYLVYALVSLGLFLVLPEAVYNFLFMQTSVFEIFLGYNWWSVLAFHLLFLLIILLAPGSIYLFLSQEKQEKSNNEWE